MRVDGNISDLFFNTEHAYNLGTGEYHQIETEAQDFLESLDRLGVSVPSVADLIEDFHNRI
jgi:hypothetical protein